MPKSRKRKARSQPARPESVEKPSPARKPGPNLPDLPQPAEMAENDRKIKISALAFRQQAALPVIALAPSIAQAARDSGIAESTLRRWLQDPRFREELTQLRQESAELARQEFQGLLLRSATVIAQAMHDPDPAIRLRAARYAMTYAARIAEAEKLGADIKELREALDSRMSRPSEGV